MGAPLDKLTCLVKRVLDLERIAREESLHSLARERFEDPFVQRIVELAAATSTYGDPTQQPQPKAA
jgi:hypothetical protein